MKIKVLLVVVLSSLFAIAYQYSFSPYPVCRPPDPKGPEIHNTFVVVLDQLMPWKYRERLVYLLKHIACVLPATPDLPTIALTYSNEGTKAIPGTSSQLLTNLVLNPNAGEEKTKNCGRFEYQMNQITAFKADFMKKNVQFLVPITPDSENENCSLIEVFKDRLKDEAHFSEFHFNGILLNGNWSEEKKLANNIIIDVPNIDLMNPQMTSMTSDENVDYVVKTAGIVQQINDFLHRTLGTKPVRTTTTTEIVETFAEETTTEEMTTTEEEETTTTEEEYDEEIETEPTSIVKSYTDAPSEAFYAGTTPRSDNLVMVKKNDMIRDYFWYIVIILVIIIVLLFCIMVALCKFCCFGNNKTEEKSSSSRSTSSRSGHDPAREPLLPPKNKKPVIVSTPKHVQRKHDEIDEWNQIKPGSRENEGVSAEPIDEPVQLDYGEMKISERQMTEGNENEQRVARVKRGYHKNQAPTGFSVE